MNTRKSRPLGIEVVHLESPHPFGELREAGNIVLVHLLHPCGEDHGKTCAMRDIVDCAYFMFYGVGSPVAFTTGVEEVIVGDTAGPHDFGTGIVIIGIFQNMRHIVDDCLEPGLTEPVGELDILCIGEIPLHDVCHDVGRSAGSLIRGKRKGKLRIHERKARPHDLVGKPPLELLFLI